MAPRRRCGNKIIGERITREGTTILDCNPSLRCGFLKIKKLRVPRRPSCKQLPATLAERLRLTYAERTALQITTIRAIDCTEREQANRREARKRQARTLKRRKQGVRPRAEYLAASTSATKPWEVEGVSRRTWYRRRGTGLTPANNTNWNQTCAILVKENPGIQIPGVKEQLIGSSPVKRTSRPKISASQPRRCRSPGSTTLLDPRSASESNSLARYSKTHARLVVYWETD
jgi:hypothetical protein